MAFLIIALNRAAREGHLRRKGFRVTPALTKVDSLLRATSFDILFMLESVFRLFNCSVVVVEWSVFQRNTRVIQEDT